MNKILMLCCLLAGCGQSYNTPDIQPQVGTYDNPNPVLNGMLSDYVCTDGFEYRIYGNTLIPIFDKNTGRPKFCKS